MTDTATKSKSKSKGASKSWTPQTVMDRIEDAMATSSLTETNTVGELLDALEDQIVTAARGGRRRGRSS